MTPIQKLEASVRKLYEAKNPDRDEWADWMLDHHVTPVADNASRLARRFGANEDLARAGALLHDIADTRMSRFNDSHEEASLAMGRELMHAAGFGEADIRLAVDDAVRYHSCHSGKTPESLEGKVLATADAAVHFQTDFYLHALWAKTTDTPLEDFKAWVLKKLDRDLNEKILFDKVRDECREDYERLKAVFSR